MTIGLSGKFNILHESPLDHHPPEPKITPVKSGRWVASRYNVQTPTEDGRLIVWNTLNGAVSTFPAKQRDAIKALLTRRGCEATPKGLAGYLHDRGFLIPEGTDEYRLFQHRFGYQHYRQDTLELILLASEDCNFRCEYCYEEFARGTMKPEVRAAVRKLVANRLSGLRYLLVSWFGGEPLYGWPAIEELGPFFRQVALDNSLTFLSNMTTNGYLLTPDVAEKLLSWGVLRYQITIDGAPEDHNHNRPTRNGEPTFDVIFRNLQEIRRRPESYTIDIRINFDQRNQSGLNDFVDLLGREFGNDPRFNVRVRPVGRWGGPNDKDLDVCGLDQAREVSYQLIDRAAQHGLGNADDIGHARPFGSKVCYAARPYNFIIGADGLVMKCTVDLDREDRNVVGRLKEDGTLQLDAAKFTLWTEPAYTSDQGCQKCVILPLCQGISCPQVRMDENRSPCIPLRRNAKRDLLLADKFRTNPTQQRVVKSESA
ncbi:MAG: radical SAM protein [Acidobacteriota bacterium]